MVAHFRTTWYRKVEECSAVTCAEISLMVPAVRVVSEVISDFVISSMTSQTTSSWPRWRILRVSGIRHWFTYTRTVDSGPSRSD